jgi:putative ABC transport system substrate-binding protein
MRRREFIAGLGAVAWPLAARAQQAKMPVIGFLGVSSPEVAKEVVADFRGGLRDAGYIEGQNVAIEFRWANGRPEVLRELATELVCLQVAVIVAAGAVAAPLAAKAATSTIPIILAGGVDPVKYGLAASLNQPGGNVTGVTYLTEELAGKRLDLLLKLVPQATTVGYLTTRPQRQVLRDNVGELLTAAHAVGRQIIVLECRALSDFDTAFATMVERQAGAVVVEAFALAFNNRDKILSLAAHHKIPAIYVQNQYVYGGGLMSYGSADLSRQVAMRYVARILKGAKPADLPIEQPTNFQLAINLKTAKALGLTIPPTLLALADEVIE